MDANRGRLARAAARGGAVSALGTWGRFLFQFGTVIVIARILGPGEYGFAAIVLVFSSVSELLRGSGLASAILQRDDLDRAIASRVHYVSCAVGALLGGAMLLLAKPLAQVFSDDRVIAFAPLLAIVLLCAGASAVPMAMLARELRFARLAALEFGAAVIGCAVALALAVNGAGAASLVWQAVTVAVITCGGALIASSFRPGWPASRARTRPYVQFGLNSAVTQIVRYASQNVDRVLLATTAQAASVGVYAQAMQLIQLPIAQLSAPLQRVIIPVLSRLVDERDRYRLYFRSVLHVFAVLLWPVLSVLAVLSPAFIEVVFGTAWATSADLMRLLAGTGFVAPVIFAASWAFVSTGSARHQALLMVGVSTMTVTAVIIAAPHGAAGVALAVSASSAASLIPAVALARFCAPLRLADFSAPLLWPAVLSVIGGASAWAATLSIESAALSLGTGMLTAVAALAATFFLIPPLRRATLGILALLRRGDHTSTAQKLEPTP